MDSKEYLYRNNFRICRKVWADNNNQDGKRPSSIELTLYRPKLNGNGEYITDKKSVENNDQYLNGKVYKKSIIFNC